MKTLLFAVTAATFISSGQCLAQNRPGVDISYHLDPSTGELTFEGAEAQNFPNILGNLAPWGAVKENQGLKNKFTSSTEGIACIGDAEFATTAICENGQTEIPVSIEYSADIDRRNLSRNFARKVRYLLSLMPIEGGSGFLKDLLLKNTPTGTAFLVRRINCEKNFLTNDVKCVLEADAFIKK